MNNTEKTQQKTLQKQMAEKLLEASEDKINRNIKDSVHSARSLMNRGSFIRETE